MPQSPEEVSSMRREHSLAVRSRAVSMVIGGMKPGQVAQDLEIPKRSLERWLALHGAGKGLENQEGRGRKSTITRIAKIVIAKSAFKRGHSTRKLSNKLSQRGHPVSKSSVHRYLRTCLGLKPLKSQLQPKLSPEQRRRRLEFAKQHSSWTIDDWRRVIFSDESPYQLHHPPNRQNDRVWAHGSSDVVPTETVKHPTKVIVWGAMSFRGLSDLHVVPRGQTVTASYYQDNILETALKSALSRTRENGPPTRALHPDMSKVIFQQDGAPVHTAGTSQQWCEEHLSDFWRKEVWPPNSPDLSPIENLWAIVQNKMDEMPAATSRDGLVDSLKLAWRKIPRETLDNLISGMPERMQACVKERGGYIGK